MWAIFWQTLKDRKLSLIIYALSGILLIWMYIAFFPSIKDQTANLEKLLESYPKALLEAFNFDIKSLTTIEGFLSGEQFSFVWPIMLIFFIVGYAGSALAGEIEKGTIEVTLSQPVSRLKIFLAKYLAGLLLLVVFTLLTILPAMPIIKAYNISYEPKGFIDIALVGFLFGLAIYSIAVFCSSIFSDKGKVYFATGGLLIVMYVLKIIASIKDNLENLKYFSFFHYFDQSQALVYHQIDYWTYLVFGGTALVFIILAATWFSKRDVAV